MAEKTWRQIYEEINKAKAEKADAKKKPKALDADQKKARAVESIRRGEGTLEDSIRTKLVDVEDLVKPREVAKADSARSETLINKLITSKAKKEKELADVIDTFDDSGSSTDSLRIKNQIDKIESKLVELTGVGGTDSTSFDASYQKPSTVKKQSWISKMMWGTEEEQEKNAWIDSYIQQDRISAANGESGVPRKSRTNQWYAQRAEEAYAEKMKIKDPAGLAPYIKTGDSQAPAIRGIQAPAIGDTTTYTSPDGGYKETKVRIRPEQHNLNVDKWKERIDAETDPVRKNALERYRDMGFAP